MSPQGSGKGRMHAKWVEREEGGRTTANHVRGRRVVSIIWRSPIGDDERVEAQPSIVGAN